MGHTAWAPEGREGRSQAGPKGRKLEVRPRRGPRLLANYISSSPASLIALRLSIFSLSDIGNRSPQSNTARLTENSGCSKTEDKKWVFKNRWKSFKNCKKWLFQKPLMLSSQMSRRRLFQYLEKINIWHGCCCCAVQLLKLPPSDQTNVWWEPHQSRLSYILLLFVKSIYRRD